MPFKPGQSGNPGGRPKGYVEVRELARKYTAKALRRLAHEVDHGDSSAARISASTALLDRGWGKPAQSVTADIMTRPADVGTARAFIDREINRMRERLDMGSHDVDSDLGQIAKNG